MAFETGWIVFGILVVVFVLFVVVYYFWGKNIEAHNRLKQIRAYKVTPQKIEGAAVLIHGTAGSKGVVMPAGGDPHAFHATFIMSSDCRFSLGNGYRKALPTRSSFRIFLTSGDFTVIEAGKSYTVSIHSTLERMKMGAEYFTEKYRTDAVFNGIAETVFDNLVQFLVGSQALEPVFDITETGSSFTSTIDSRVRTFREGTDVPPGIAEILKEKNIHPQPGEEITVIEFFIPVKKSVWVFGEFDGRDTVKYGKGKGGLYISYVDPDTAGVKE